MATYTFTINKQEVFAEVEKRSSLEGAAIPDSFEGVWASAAEGAFLDSHWIEGCSLALQLFKRYIKNATSSTDLSTFTPSETFTIEADLPTRFDGNLVQNITTDMKMMIACNILNRWLAVVNPASAAKYDEESTGYTEDLKNKLMYRTAPTAEMVTDTTADSKFESGEYYGSKAKTDEDFESGEFFGEKSGTETAIESGEFFGEKVVTETAIESGNYFGEKSGTDTNLETGEYFGTKSAEESALESGEYFGEKSVEETTLESGDYYGEKSASEELLESGEYFGEKDNTETEFERGSELATKSVDSETMESGAYFITKEKDNYNFTQYEKCCNHP